MHKKLSLVRNIFLSNVKSLYSPYKATFALTYKCNLKCKICRIWEWPNKEELNIKEIEKIFKSLKTLSWLDLTGGEITLREDIIEIIKVIIKNVSGLSIFHISTNGQLSNKVYLIAKEILKFKLIPIINISIDGPRIINDNLRGVEGAYLKSLETFNLLKSLNKGYYYLSCTISNYNINYLDELIRGLKNDISCFSFSDLHFNIFHNSPHYYKNNSIDGLSKINFDSIKKYLKFCNKGNIIKRFLEERYIKGLSRYLNGNRFPMMCQALRSTFFINPYGEIYPCGLYNKVIGNLKDYDYNLNKLWNSLNVLRIRGDIAKNDCPGCWSPCEAYPAILGHLS